MPVYYLNHRAQSNGEHLVHRAGCLWLPYIEKMTSLGYRRNCREALQEARKHYRQVNGCEVCLEECHTSAKTGRTRSGR